MKEDKDMDMEIEMDMDMEINSRDIYEMYKMENTVNEVDRLISQKIEIVEDNGEIRSWTLDTRPVKEMPSKTIIKEVSKLYELLSILQAKTTWSLITGELPYQILEKNRVQIQCSRDASLPDNHATWTTIGNSHRKGIRGDGSWGITEVGEDDFITFRVNQKKLDVRWVNSTEKPTISYGDAKVIEALAGPVLLSELPTMRNVIDYINEVLEKAEQVYPIIDLIEQHYDQVQEYYKIKRFVDDRLVDLTRFSHLDFDSNAVWSNRTYRIRYDRDDKAEHIISEIKLQERKNERGYVAYFTDRILKHNGACYSATPMMLFVKEIGEGEDKRVRLLWKYKNKFSFGRIPSYGRVHEPYLSVLYTFLNKLYTKEQVLPIMKYMKLYRGFEDGQSYMPVSIQLHGVSQSAMYWIGNETSVKKIMAKAYGKSGVDGLTKHAFGGLNNLDTIEKLVIAARFVRAFRAMKPQFFENIYQAGWENEDEKHYEVYKFGANLCSIKQIEDYIKYFNTKAFQDLFNSGEWTKYQFSEIALTVDNFKRIRSTRLRTAIRNHVKRSNFNLEQTLEFVTQEMHKTRDSDVVIKTKYDKHHNHKINDEITVIMPRRGSDLVAWGAVQNNCIGGYVDKVADGRTSIFGFKDSNNNWIAHAEIKNNRLEQLLGKHNNNVASEYYKPIIKWLKSINVKTNGSFWGRERE